MGRGGRSPHFCHPPSHFHVPPSPVVFLPGPAAEHFHLLGVAPLPPSPLFYLLPSLGDVGELGSCLDSLGTVDVLSQMGECSSAGRQAEAQLYGEAAGSE